MKNEFEDLENLLDLLVTTGWDPSQLDSLNAEKERVLSAMTSKIITIKNELQISYYVRWHQKNLSILLDKLSYDSDKAGDAYTLLKNVLDILLDFRRAFSKDFDYTRPIPEALQLIDPDGLRNSSHLLSHYFEDSGIDKNLSEILLIPLTDFLLLKPQVKVSFEKYHYIQAYVNELLNNEFSCEECLELEISLFHTVIRLNYNHIRLFGYFTDRITQSTDATASIREKVDILRKFRKKISQYPFYKNLSYDQRLPPIKKQLITWIEEEIQYLNCFEISSDIKEDILPSLKLNLSVAQMAYFTSLLYKHDVFQQRVKTRIIEIMTQTFSSRETDKISTESFKARFQRPNDSAARSIRKLLKSMIDDVDAFLN